jgi:branched-chain amino acid transport system permease protein
VTQLINSIFFAGLYASLALGLTLVFGVMRLVNLAHGDIMIGAGYLAVLFGTHLGLDPLVALALIIPVVMLVCYPLQRGLLNPLLSHGEEPPLVATFGLSLIAETVFLIGYTSNSQSLNPHYAFTGVHILGTDVRTILIISLVVGEAAASMGINVKHVYALTFAVAAALSAFAGVEIGVAFSLTPTAGLTWLLIAFTVIVLGGMGSVIGTLLGGFVVALAQEYGALAFGPQYQDLVVFGLLVVILVVRPQGILGKKLT